MDDLDLIKNNTPQKCETLYCITKAVFLGIVFGLVLAFPELGTVAITIGILIIVIPFFIYDQKLKKERREKKKKENNNSKITGEE